MEEFEVHKTEREGGAMRRESFGCGSKLTRRGKPRVLVHVYTYQGSILVPVL